MKKLPVLTLAFTLLLASCGPGSPDMPTPEVSTAVASTSMPDDLTPGPLPTQPPPTPIPSLESGLPPAELKYRLLERYPDFFYCDPDYYPVGRGDEAQLALERFPEIQADAEEFQAILSHNGLEGQTAFTDDQKLLIYREHKKLAAIPFELDGERYRFQIQTGIEGQEGAVIQGRIDGQGRITEDERTPGFPACPICLAVHTLIDTPRGPVPVEALKIGDPVWTLDRFGERVAATVSRAAHVTAPASHQVVHLVLDDGRELWASPGHPTADGRLLGDLRPGDTLDGARVALAELVPYTGGATYDILPSGETGFYWANGILMGSTYP
ncbi:MAG: Hint domain-containing protein [Chloroflexota bacterium]